MTSRFLKAALMAAIAFAVCAAVSASATAPQWLSPNRYRILMTVDTRGILKRTNSPVAVNVDFQQYLSNLKVKGNFDENTVEVVAYDPSGVPFVYNSSRSGYEKYLVPLRIDRYYGVNYVTLNFALPDSSHTKIAVYLDTKESKLGKPRRYAGLVGDGDYFRQGFGRRETGATVHDDFCDFDGDGDLDLIKVTAEPFLFYNENVGGNRFVDRGKMTSDGTQFLLPMGSNHRSWPSVTFDDWDGDGDHDFFVSFLDGPESGQVLRFENTTRRGGPMAFINRGRLTTASGESLGSGWFTITNVVDWDADGKKDLLVSRNNLIQFYRNVANTKSLKDVKLADPIAIQANGKDLAMSTCRVECKDIDSDGDLDMLIGSYRGKAYLYTNTGTRTTPQFGDEVEIPASGREHMGIKVTDFNGDGLLDYVCSASWERNPAPGERRWYARTYRNVGTKTEPKFEELNVNNGALYTEGFQMCDAARQSSVRVADMDADGKGDFVATTDTGMIYWFRNLSASGVPIFADPLPLMYDGGAFVKSDVCDWNNDGKQDILVGAGYLKLYLNEGSAQVPKFGSSVNLDAGGKVISGTGRDSVLVCDWDNDGKKDVIYGMGGESGPLPDPQWPVQSKDNWGRDKGFLFYKNVGTDAEPVLAYPKWLVQGMEGDKTVITFYVRPNLGDYVDWDGDGKKDFIACQFENAIRFFPNQGSGAPGTEPELGWPEDGFVLVEPWTVQTISGAKAIDWNSDGDLDIITGQGHSGTGIRFYERDYIEDFANRTEPITMIDSFESKSSINSKRR